MQAASGTRQPTFSKVTDYEDYQTHLDLKAVSCAEHGVAAPAPCLLPDYFGRVTRR